MVSNQIEVNGRSRTLSVDNQNTVTVIQYRQRKVDQFSDAVAFKSKEKFRLCVISKFDDREILQCISRKGEHVIFSINLCSKIISVPINDGVQFFYVCGEVIIKIDDGNKQRLYDEAGNLLAVETEYDITPIFSGCNISIQRKHKLSEKISFHNLEGCPC